MPEFQLDHGTADAGRRFASLDAFTQGYIEALFFTECETGTTREDHDPQTQSSLPGDATVADLSAQAWARIMEECAQFQAGPAGAILDRLYQGGDAISGVYTAAQAGRDYWFTRNGHGVGYWDRDLGPDGDTLSDLARKDGEVYPSFGDDGQIYLD